MIYFIARESELNCTMLCFIIFKNWIQHVSKLKPKKNQKSAFHKLRNNDVGDIFMLATSFCWWLYDDDWFQTLTISCWCKNLGDLLKELNRSPTSQTCHQHIWSPRSVTNIHSLTLTYGNKLVIIIIFASYGWYLRSTGVFIFSIEFRIWPKLIFEFEDSRSRSQTEITNICENVKKFILK